MKTSVCLLLAVTVACASTQKAEPVVSSSGAVEEAPARADHVDPDDRAVLAKPPADAEHTASGIASQVIAPGSGKIHPSPHSMVRVHYTGWTTDGQVFDSSRSRGKPAEFSLDQVIPGWTEGVQLMVVGEERRFWIPADLAYGREARPGAPSGELTFDIELLAIVYTPNIPDVPEDVAAAPADAKHTDSGLAYKTIILGTGVRPDRTDTVTIDYTGWTPAGQMFDSTFNRNRGSVTFKVENAIKGWAEGLQLMQEGETTRFWIPQKLMFGDGPTDGTPRGDVVFDIHLIGIE